MGPVKQSGDNSERDEFQMRFGGLKDTGLGDSLYVSCKNGEGIGMTEVLAPSLLKEKLLECMILTYRIYHFSFISLLPPVLLLE